jgi:hypothetical protein
VSRLGLLGSAALLCAAGGCDQRPFGRPIDRAGWVDSPAPAAANEDASALPCGPGLPLSLCGVVGGQSVRYTPQYGFQATARSQQAVTYNVIGLDGVWLDIWGDMAPWTDSAPRQVSGWLLRPPAGWLGKGEWICGQSGTITHNADNSVAATLGALSVVPRCNGGGSESLYADLFGGFIPFDIGPGCWIGFRANDTPMTLLTDSCPKLGVALPLDGARIVRGEAPDTTACLGNGASLLLLPDTSPTGGSHLIIDIPSMSAPQSCGSSSLPEDGLFMNVAAPALHGG